MHPTQDKTECRQQTFQFQGLGGRRVEADFSGGHLSSDGGCLLLREVDRAHRICEELAGCFTDHRNQDFVEHDLPVMLRQRIMGIALGYEDLNDHDRLRLDPLLAAACGRADVLGEERHQTPDKGRPLAGKSTLNRLEAGAWRRSGLHKIEAHAERIESLLLRQGVKAIPRKRRVIVLDFDATDDTIHGGQEGRFYHGYYGDYCYLPLYCFCGDIPLWAQLRTSDRDASEGTVEALGRIVAAIRERFGKHVMIVVRGDSGFCREEIMAWIEGQPNMRYVLGLARNRRLEGMLAPFFWEAAAQLDEDLALCARMAGADRPPEMEGSARAFAELRYRTRESWSRERRVVGKAELTGGKENPRFIVTNIGTGPGEEWAGGLAEFADGQSLYEMFYCARGDMENRIKEQQLDMFADRTSTSTMKSNQLRLWFSTFAYLLVRHLRATALAGTRLARATVGTIRLRLMKIAAQVTVSVRRIYVRLCGACPMADVFARAHAVLTASG